jgi:hypothetical protein
MEIRNALISVSWSSPEIWRNGRRCGGDRGDAAWTVGTAIETTQCMSYTPAGGHASRRVD